MKNLGIIKIRSYCKGIFFGIGLCGLGFLIEDFTKGNLICFLLIIGMIIFGHFLLNEIFKEVENEK